MLRTSRATRSRERAKYKKAGRNPRVEIKTPPIEAMATSIRAFCAAHDISIDTYFRMQRRGEGPQTMKVRGRTLISAEAARAWRKERELAAPQRAKVAAGRTATPPAVS